MSSACAWSLAQLFLLEIRITSIETSMQKSHSDNLQPQALAILHLRKQPVILPTAGMAYAADFVSDSAPSSFFAAQAPQLVMYRTPCNLFSVCGYVLAGNWQTWHAPVSKSAAHSSHPRQSAARAARQSSSQNAQHTGKGKIHRSHESRCFPTAILG